MSKDVKILDGLFSEYVRRRAITRCGGCERCLTSKPTWKMLQCSHFWGRARFSIRWDEDNAVGLCGACHLYLTGRPLEHVEWFKEKLGESTFDMLNGRMRVVGKPDKLALSIYYKHKIGEILR